MTVPEHGLCWKKAKASSDGGNCVEVAVDGDGTVHIRDSKDRGGPHLHFSGTAWTSFLAGVQGMDIDPAP